MGTEKDEMVPLRIVRPGDRPDELAPAIAQPPAAASSLSALAEIELVARCQRGERRAFDELYLTFRRPLARQLVRMLGPRADVEDTLQEVFLEVFRSIARFRGDARLATWLYRLTAHVAYHRLRTRKRKEPRTDEIEDRFAAPAASPEERLSGQRELAEVHRILQTLAPKKRMVFVLHELEGLEIEEIARIVGAPRVTVRTRLFYARREFFATAASRIDRVSRAAGGEDDA